MQSIKINNDTLHIPIGYGLRYDTKTQSIDIYPIDGAPKSAIHHPKAVSAPTKQKRRNKESTKKAFALYLTQHGPTPTLTLLGEVLGNQSKAYMPYWKALLEEMAEDGDIVQVGSKTGKKGAIIPIYSIDSHTPTTKAITKKVGRPRKYSEGAKRRRLSPERAQEVRRSILAYLSNQQKPVRQRELLVEITGTKYPHTRPYWRNLIEDMVKEGVVTKSKTQPFLIDIPKQAQLQS